MRPAQPATTPPLPRSVPRFPHHAVLSLDHMIAVRQSLCKSNDRIWSRQATCRTLCRRVDNLTRRVARTTPRRIRAVAPRTESVGRNELPLPRARVANSRRHLETHHTQPLTSTSTGPTVELARHLASQNQIIVLLPRHAVALLDEQGFELDPDWATQAERLDTRWTRTHVRIIPSAGRRAQARGRQSANAALPDMRRAR
jgi:hypothetical protein